MTESLRKINGSNGIGNTLAYNYTFVGQTIARTSSSANEVLTIFDLYTSNWLYLGQYGGSCAIYYIWWHGSGGYKYQVYDNTAGIVNISINNQ